MEALRHFFRSYTGTYNNRLMEELCFTKRKHHVRKTLLASLKTEVMMKTEVWILVLLHLLFWSGKLRRNVNSTGHFNFLQKQRIPKSMELRKT